MRSHNSPEPDPRHSKLRDYISTLYLEANGLTVPWNGRTAKVMADFLACCKWPLDALQAAVQNRFDSEGVNLSEDPLRWISKLPNYAKSPLNKFGQPIYRQTRKPVTESVLSGFESAADYFGLKGRVN